MPVGEFVSYPAEHHHAQQVRQKGSPEGASGEELLLFAFPLRANPRAIER